MITWLRLHKEGLWKPDTQSHVLGCPEDSTRAHLFCGLSLKPDALGRLSGARGLLEAGLEPSRQAWGGGEALRVSVRAEAAAKTASEGAFGPSCIACIPTSVSST